MLDENRLTGCPSFTCLFRETKIVLLIVTRVFEIDINSQWADILR